MELRDIVKAKAVLKIGQRVEIVADDEYYTSRVEDITAGDLVLAMPLDSKRRPIIPAVGDTIDVRIISDMCIYQFYTVYKDKAAKPIPVWIVTLPEEMERKQHRKFVRVKASLPISVQVPDTEGGFQAAKPTETKDISGNGFLFVFDKAIALQTKIVLETDMIPQIGRIKTFAEVVRCSKPFNDRNMYWIGVKFIGLPRPVQNKLVQFVFKKQREELAKRLDR